MHFAYRNSGDSESPEFRGAPAARAGPWNCLGTEQCPSSQRCGHGGRLFPAKNSKIRIIGLFCTEFFKSAPSFSGAQKRLLYFMILYIFISHCIIYGDRDLFWFVQARPRPYFFGAGIVGAYFLLAQQNFGTEFSTLEKIWSRSIFDIQTRPRAPYFRTGCGVK